MTEFKESDLIYDWNLHNESRFQPDPPIEFDDETLRDGLQCPSVTDPPIGKKIEILHLMNDLGIHTATLGLPAAGPRASPATTHRHAGIPRRRSDGAPAFSLSRPTIAPPPARTWGRWCGARPSPCPPP
ncbi:hypothetical protein IH799_09775, partial [candidate division KSB1 bacterium]|nr:hypothetical protein [candidate division KSB1 bacterium]